MGGGKKKRSESRRWLTKVEELEIALSEIETGSDRVAAVMGAALMENFLSRALASLLEEDSDIAKLFDDVRGPLSTFYGQILMARALGLVPHEEAEALHAVRQIRNQFAHSVFSLDFENERISSKCVTRLKSFARPEEFDERPISINRRYYEHACYVIGKKLVDRSRQNTWRKARNLADLAQTLDAELVERGHDPNPELPALVDSIPTDTEGGD